MKLPREIEEAYTPPGLRPVGGICIFNFPREFHFRGGHFSVFHSETLNNSTIFEGMFLSTLTAEKRPFSTPRLFWKRKGTRVSSLKDNTFEILPKKTISKEFIQSRMSFNIAFSQRMWLKKASNINFKLFKCCKND